ncbi:MAG TPA: hypothetical protein VEB68_10505 [Croceibacterium sp.]|nr:hypothetical protein [Propylenella sp.]HYD25219.1 hypothetical protein [Croceibacterium sp.]
MDYPTVRSLALAGAVFILSSCGSRVPDQVFHVCLDRGEINESVVSEIRTVAERHRLTFNDNSQNAKADLIEIDAEDGVAPDGVPVFFDIQKGGRGVLIGSNFGSQGEDLRLSFFDADSEPDFKSDMMEILSSLPDARVLTVDPASDGPSPC